MFKIPIVKVTYQGKVLTEKFYNQHPEIHHLYPTKEEFISKYYKPLFETLKKTNTEQILEISENSIKINGFTH